MGISKSAKKNMKALSESTGLPQSQISGVIAEAILPLLKPDQVVQAVKDSQLCWLLLADGESCTLRVGAWDLIRFRTRISQYGNSQGIRYSVSSEQLDDGWCDVTVLREGERTAGHRKNLDIDESWKCLKPGESVSVTVPEWKESRFRNLVSQHSRRMGVKMSVSIAMDDKGCIATVTNKGPKSKLAVPSSQAGKDESPSKGKPSNGLDAF